MLHMVQVDLRCAKDDDFLIEHVCKILAPAKKVDENVDVLLGDFDIKIKYPNMRALDFAVRGRKRLKEIRSQCICKSLEIKESQFTAENLFWYFSKYSNKQKAIDAIKRFDGIDLKLIASALYGYEMYFPENAARKKLVILTDDFSKLYNLKVLDIVKLFLVHTYVRQFNKNVVRMELKEKQLQLIPSWHYIQKLRKEKIKRERYE